MPSILHDSQQVADAFIHSKQEKAARVGDWRAMPDEPSFREKAQLAMIKLPHLIKAFNETLSEPQKDLKKIADDMYADILSCDSTAYANALQTFAESLNEDQAEAFERIQNMQFSLHVPIEPPKDMLGCPAPAGMGDMRAFAISKILSSAINMARFSVDRLPNTLILNPYINIDLPEEEWSDVNYDSDDKKFAMRVSAGKGIDPALMKDTLTTKIPAILSAPEHWKKTTVKRGGRSTEGFVIEGNYLKTPLVMQLADLLSRDKNYGPEFKTDYIDHDKTYPKPVSEEVENNFSPKNIRVRYTLSGKAAREIFAELGIDKNKIKSDFGIV